MEIKEMNLNEIQTRKAEIKTLLDDEKSNIEELSKEVDELETREKELKENQEKRDALIEKVVNLDDSHIIHSFNNEEKEERKEVNIYETKEYRDAWTNSVKAGDSSIVRRFLTTENQESAGVLVPTELENKINDTFEKTTLLQKFTITSIKGLTETPYVTSKTDPEWHQEVDASGNATSKKEKEVKFAVAGMSPEYIAEILETSKKFEALTIDAFFSWLMTELPNALTRKIIAGALSAPQTGVYGTRGILTNTDTTLVKPVTSALDFNTVNIAVGGLGDDLGELTVVMNKQTFYSDIMGLKDTTGRPIFNVGVDNTGKPQYFINGIAIEFNSNIPAYADAVAGDVYMVVGDLKAYQLNFPEGTAPNIIRDAITKMEHNIIRYRSEVLVAGNVVKRESLAVVKKA